MTTWIAEEHVIWVLASGERRVGRIAVGLPEMVPDDGARRSARSRSMAWNQRGPSAAKGTMQALLLALRLGGMRLYVFISKGMSVRCPIDDSEVDLSEIFGAFLAQPDRFVESPDVEEAKNKG